MTPPAVSMEGQWRHIQEKHVLHLSTVIATEDGGLYRCTECNGLVRVDTLAKLLATKEVTEERLNFWNACAATNQYYLVHGALVHAAVPQHFLDRLESARKRSWHSSSN